MAKQNLFKRLRVLSRPTGKPQWAQAVRSLILMVLAGLIAFYLGLDKGIQVIITTTLIATIIMDISLPLRKILPLTLLGFLMAILVFTTVTLGLNSVPLFILFTVFWSFFAMSTYIFGESVGFFGFIIFAVYFIAVLMVNNNSTALEWISYCALSFAVASLLLLPRIWNRKKEIRKMVAVGFIPGTPLKTVLNTRRAISGIPIDTKYYELFRLGTYMTGFRGYSRQLLNRLSGENQEKFKEYLETADQASSQIAESITKNRNQVDIPDLETILSRQDVDKDSNNDDISAFIDVAYKIKDLIQKSALTIKKPLYGDKKEITSSQTSIKEILVANFNLKNIYIRHALRFTLAMTIGLLLVHLTHDRDVIWVTMGILIIIKPDITSTVNNMLMRVFFNILAIIVAIIMGFIFPHGILLALAFLMLFFFRAFLPTYMGLSVMALTIFVVFIWPTGTVFDNAIARLIDISLGAIIAFICAYIILPSRMTVDLPGQLAKTIKANKEYLEALVKPENYDHQAVVNSLNNYLLEENNLEAAIRKLGDFFTNLGEDVIQYQELLAANRKLSADISALAAFMENEALKRSDNGLDKVEKENITDLEYDWNQINQFMDNLGKIIDQGLKPSKTYLGNYFHDYDNSFLINNFKQYLEWVISDVELLQELILKADGEDLFKKYRDLN